MKYIYTLVLLFPCFIFSQPPGNGMVFDGNSDYYTVNDNSSIDMNGSFTIEAWINPCDTLGHKMILSKQWCNGSLSSYYFSFLNGKLKWFWNNNGVCGVSSGGNSYESTGNIIRNNIWQHVAVVHTPTSITFYYNGVAVAGGLVSGLYGGILFNSSEPLRVGTYRRNSGSYDFFLNGRIDEVRFWNTALSSSQILSRFTTSLAGNETSLQLYHNFESISGLVINNSCTATGAVNNGTNAIGLVRTWSNLAEYPRSFNLGNDTILCDSNRLSISIPLFYSGYLWNDGTTSNIKPISSSGTYIGFAYRDFCFATDTILVSIVDCDTTSNPIDSCTQNFLMPNVFSPNGDGINEIFKPIYYDCFSLISFKVYNRWGQLIFESSSKIEWDGKVKNVKKVSDGTYFWIIHHKNQQGIEDFERGFLNVFHG